MTTSASLLPTALSVRDAFEQWAESYDDNLNPVVAVQERILRAVLPDALAKTVVDVGCGTGRTLALWREQRADRLIGIDFSLAMLRTARTPGSLIAADCTALPFADGAADLVSCCLTLGYLAGLDAFASEVARVVSRDGSILISELHPESVLRFGWHRGFAHHGQTVHIESRAFPIDEVVAVFKQFGFESDLLLEIPFGTSELPLFEAAGRKDQFERFRDYPAVYVLQLSRTGWRRASAEPITLCHASVALSATEAIPANVTIAEQMIGSVGIRETSEDTSTFLSGYLVLPGLINAHDHLEFALFPRLGRGRYQNSREWAEEIYRPDDSPIREHLRVPKWVRLWWGAIRNLLCGVTTVCHHNPYEPEVFGEDFPVRVIRDFAWAHSLAFEPGAVERFRDANSDVPFVIHAAEGIDGESREELGTLFRLGMLGTRTVIVHGTALDDEGLDLMKECGAALVWCPSSNIFLFNQTLGPEQVAALPSKALGSDSPLTSAGDLLDEIRFAAKLGSRPEMLYELVTGQPKQVLKLKQREGRIRPGAVADMVAVLDRGLSPAETLATLSHSEVELVIKTGRVCLASDAMKAHLPAKLTAGLELLKVDGLQRWARAPIRQMLELSREALGPEIRMCGRVLTQ